MRLVWGRVELNGQTCRSADTRRGLTDAQRSAALRRQMLRELQCHCRLLILDSMRMPVKTVLLSCILHRTISDNGGVAQLPSVTRSLMGMGSVPFLIPGGVSLTKCGLSPFMVREHGQRWGSDHTHKVQCRTYPPPSRASLSACCASARCWKYGLAGTAKESAI